jgi:hypothetical protein
MHWMHWNSKILVRILPVPWFRHFINQIPSPASHKVFCRGRGSGVNFSLDSFINNESIKIYIDTLKLYRYRKNFLLQHRITSIY